MSFDRFSPSAASANESNGANFCENTAAQPTYKDVNTQAMQWIIAESQNLQGLPTGGSAGSNDHCSNTYDNNNNNGGSGYGPGNSMESNTGSSSSNCNDSSPTVINNIYCNDLYLNQSMPTSAGSGGGCEGEGSSGGRSVSENPSGGEGGGGSNHYSQPTGENPPEYTQPTQPTTTATTSEVPTTPTQTTPTAGGDSTATTPTQTTTDAQGYQTSISGSFPANYWADRYPNAGAPSWNNTYGGATVTSPLDNSSSIAYSQTYQVTPQYYSGANGQPGYYNTYSWNKYNNQGTRYGGN